MRRSTRWDRESAELSPRVTPEVVTPTTPRETTGEEAAERGFLSRPGEVDCSFLPLFRVSPIAHGFRFEIRRRSFSKTWIRSVIPAFFRSYAQKCVKRCVTRRIFLGGGSGWPRGGEQPQQLSRCSKRHTDGHLCCQFSRFGNGPVDGERGKKVNFSRSNRAAKHLTPTERDKRRQQKGKHRSYICRSGLTQREDAFGADSSCSDSGNTTSDDSIKVTVMGAAGRVGRILSLLLKTCPLVDQLCLFDVDHSVRGICLDIGHIDTKCCVRYFCGMRNVREALDDPDVVLIAAGSPSTPHLNGETLFKKNAPIVAELSEACAKFCPEACLVLITNPINSLLPVAGEIYELITGERATEKLFGLTSLDVVRANTFVAEATRQDPSKVIVPVIGGTSEDTIVPVISQMKPCCKIKREEVVALTECVKRAERSLTDCQKCGTRGSSSLSTAYVAFRFTSSLISALKGDGNVFECAYVQSDIIPELEYMASPLKLGKCGIEHNYGYPKLSELEVSLMEKAAPLLQKDITMGKAYVMQQCGKCASGPSRSPGRFQQIVARPTPETSSP